MVGGTELIVKTELQPEAECLTQLIQTLDGSEKSKMAIFIQGFKFAQSLEKTEEKQ